MRKIKAYCEKSKDGWGECIVVYDESGKEIARSENHHPEGVKTLSWEGFQFIAHAYSGDPITECFVRCSDKVLFDI